MANLTGIPPFPTESSTLSRSAPSGSVLIASEVERSNEGGHMSSTAGRIVRTPNSTLSYKVVLSHHRRAETERAFSTIREAEAFIRRNTPIPAARNTLYDREVAS